MLCKWQGRNERGKLRRVGKGEGVRKPRRVREWKRKAACEREGISQ